MYEDVVSMIGGVTCNDIELGHPATHPNEAKHCRQRAQILIVREEMNINYPILMCWYKTTVIYEHLWPASHLWEN